MGGLRVLIVDGDGDSRAVNRMMLQHHGYEVSEAEDARAAVSQLRACQVDVVLTELTLQPVDGHVLLEWLKQDKRTRGIPVIILTARGLDSDRQRAAASGCVLFLTKPVEPRELVRMIGEVVAVREADA